MGPQMAEKFQEHFGTMTDPRVERTKLYPLEEVLFVLLCGSVCGAESWRDFVMFGQEKLNVLREYYPFSAGIPCKNTFACVTAALQGVAGKVSAYGAHSRLVLAQQKICEKFNEIKAISSRAGPA